MPYQCNPRICANDHFRDSMSWRKAVLTLLNYVVDSITGGGASVDGVYIGGVIVPYKRAFANVAASQTDAPIVAAVASKRIAVLSAVALCGDSATALTFNTKPVGAGTGISPLLYNDAAGGEVLPYNPSIWMQTNIGEGLTVTTGSGASTGIIVTYVEL